MIEEVFEQVPDVEIWLYPPDESPEPDKMKIGTAVPNLAKARAILILLMESYAIPGYKLSLLEIQKLAYFLQIIGEPLKHSFRTSERREKWKLKSTRDEVRDREDPVNDWFYESTIIPKYDQKWKLKPSF